MNRNKIGQLAMALGENDEKQVVQYWEVPLVEMVEKLLPALAPRTQIVQVGCQSGLLTQVLSDHCQRPSRLLVSTTECDTIRMPAPVAGVFPLDVRDQGGLLAPRAVQGVEGIVGLAAPFAYLRSLEQILHLVELNGFVLLGGLLCESCQELLDVFLEVLEREDLVEEQAQLSRVVPCLPRAEQVREKLVASGFDKLEILIKTGSCAFPDAGQLLDSVLTRFLCLDACLALIQDPNWQEGVRAGIQSALDTYFPHGAQLSIVLGAVLGQRTRL